MSFKLVSRNWSQEFIQASLKHCSDLLIISPFIKAAALKKVLNKQKHIRVITRFKLADFAAKVSDTAALSDLLASGASIRGVRGLHSKLFIFGDHTVIAGSANLTSAALNGNHEFGFVAESPEIVAECKYYFESLWKRAGEDLTAQRIARWEQQLNLVLSAASDGQGAATWPDEGVTIDPIVSPFIEAETKASDVAGFVKFLGESDKRAPHQLAVIDEIVRAGCHWACGYPLNKRPRQVADGDEVFLGRLVTNPNDTMIFGAAFALKHVKGRDDATEEEMNFPNRSWKKRYPHYVRLHDGKFIDGVVGNGVSLKELMEKFGANAFASTKRNLNAGVGNTVPSRAIMQKPEIRLTAVAHEWLSGELQKRFESIGMIDSSVLAGLDQPSFVGELRAPTFIGR